MFIACTKPRTGAYRSSFSSTMRSRDAVTGEINVPVELERLRHAKRCIVAVDGDGEDRMPVALLGVQRMHADVRAEIEGIGPVSDFLAAMLLTHVDTFPKVRPVARLETR